MIEQSTTKMLTTTRAAALPLLMLCLAAIAASGGRTADQTAPPGSFTFSLRSRDQRMAVVSYARMDPANLGDPPDDQLLMTRLRKMIAKNVGIIVYGLPPSRNPRSVLYGNILGVDDLDRMTEEFDPR